MTDVLQPGEKFQGYVVEKLLGRGGLGSVYLVRHEMLDTLYAMKILDPAVAGENPDYVKRFVREAKIASKIRHPNLVTVHTVGHDEAKGVYFLVMDYVAGGNLRPVIGMGGPMDHRAAVRIVAQVASALAAGEPFGVVHRDIKPENIMMEPDGSVKLVDLGVAKVRGADSLKTAAKTIFGTPNYVSPEQAVDSSAVDARADVYSLGVVLFELLCGRRPYEGDTHTAVLQQLLSSNPIPDVRTFNPKVPERLALLVQLMCAKDPDKRLGSSSELLAALAKFGYEVPKVQGEVQQPAPAAEAAQPFDYGRYAQADSNPTLSFDTQDKEIQEFVQNLKAKKRRTLVLRLAVAAAFAALVALLVVLVR